MSDFFSCLWAFLVGVGSHAVTLLAGCVITVIIALIEKYWLKKPIPLKWEITIILVFVFFACFQTWRDEYKRANGLQSQIDHRPEPKIVNEINVPPAQVIIHEPTPQNDSTRDLTGFMQLSTVGPATNYSTVAVGQKVAFNVFLKNAGTYPVHDKYAQEAIAISPPAYEVRLKKQFKEAYTAQWKRDLANKVPTSPVGAGETVYRTAFSEVLSETQVNGILSGGLRIYLFTWGVWKDSHNKSGSLEACYYLERPSTPQLTPNNTVWHTCTEI